MISQTFSGISGLRKRNHPVHTAQPSSSDQLVLTGPPSLSQPVSTGTPSSSSQPVPAPPSSSSQPVPTGHLYLIRGSFGDISRFSDSTVDWVIKIAHLLCDPLGSGHVFTHTTGTAAEWYHLNRTATWQEVLPGAQLQPGIYEFVPTRPIILSKICLRHGCCSVADPGFESNAKDFRESCVARDAGCVVNRCLMPITASHLIPKRIGSAGIQDIMARFVLGFADAAAQADHTHRFDPRIGITLSNSLDAWVDQFNVGFYHIMNNTYSCHTFHPDYPNLPAHGTPTIISISPQLHGYIITLSIHGIYNTPLPPPGVFNWHYLQCVIKRFGTPEFMNLPNINYFIQPFKTASDNEDSDDNDNYDTNPPYPSYGFNSYAQDKYEDTMEWVSGLPSAIG